MITLNLRYLPVEKHNKINLLEEKGHIVCTVDEENVYYEHDLTLKHKQQLSPHDWNTAMEYNDLYYFLLKD